MYSRTMNGTILQRLLRHGLTNGATISIMIFFRPEAEKHPSDLSSSVKDLLKVCSLLSYRLTGFNEEIMRWDTPTVSTKK